MCEISGLMIESAMVGLLFLCHIEVRNSSVNNKIDFFRRLPFDIGRKPLPVHIQIGQMVQPGLN